MKKLAREIVCRTRGRGNGNSLDGGEGGNNLRSVLFWQEAQLSDSANDAEGRMVA